MALKGSLHDFSLSQILNLINLAKKTGVLTIECPGQSAQVYFREGKLAYAQVGPEESDLATILLRSRKITNNQASIIHQRTKSMSDKEVGLMLINAGYISQKDILNSCQLSNIEGIRKLYNWMDGSFRFEQGAALPAGKIPVRIDLENLIIECSRQLREWEHLQDEIPSLDMALKFVDRPGANIKNLNLSLEEWRIVRYVNPKNTIRQIGHAARLNDLEIRRIVYSLLQAGLIEIIRPGGGPIVPSARSFPTKNKEEQKSLVNRLISRIRSI